MIYTTLKENREKDTKFVSYCDELAYPVGLIFGDEYMDDNDYTDWDKLSKDYTFKQIESKVLKWIKEDAKDKEDGSFFKYGRFLIHRTFACEDIEELVKNGELKASDVRKIHNASNKYNFSISGDIRTEDGWEYCDTFDLLDRYFPCAYRENGECNNCRNCD